MSQVISNMEPQSQINNINTNPIDDNGIDIIIHEGLKKNYEKETRLEKMEQPRPPAAPKPESTLHKVGRYLTGIFGGLLLGAGIAAATVATFASFGIAPGIVVGIAAAVGGILGSSLIAGGAGVAGIALITTSALMRPKNPGALLPQQEVQDKQAAQQMNTEKVSLKFGGDEIDTLKTALKTKHGVNGLDTYVTSQTALRNMDNLYDAIEMENSGTLLRSDLLQDGAFTNFTKEVLGQLGITNFERSEKNSLAVRFALEKYFSDVGSLHNRLIENDAPDKLQQLNNQDIKEQLRNLLNMWMETYETDDEEYKLLHIFHDALSLESVEIPKPLQNPAIQGGIEENLIEDGLQIKDVSILGQPQELPKEIRFDAQGADDTLKALKMLDKNMPDNVKGANDDLGFVLDSLEKEVPEALANNNVPVFVQTVLTNNGITNLDLTPKNVLLVRHVIARYLAKNSDKYPETVKSLNSPEGQKKYSDQLKSVMDRENDEETYNAIAIFRAAISQSDLSNLDSDENLLLQSQLIKL